MRLKPWFTSRISRVIIDSSSRESYSPSRIRLAANDNSLSGLLINRAITIEPSKVAIKAMPTHTNQVRPVMLPKRRLSVCSQ